MSHARKNIVLISLDDTVAFWKYKSIFGEELKTPNLDRICGQSTAFHSAYCQVPICSPSRASMMTGKSPHQTGITLSDKHYLDKVPLQSLLPYRMKENGYFCSSGGKVIAGYRPVSDEVQQTLYSDVGRTYRMAPRLRQHKRGEEPDSDSYVLTGGFRDGVGTIDPKMERTYYDRQVVQSARRFFKSYDGDMPFYREIGLCAAHGPWITPIRYKEMYNERAIKRPRAWGRGFDENAFMNALTVKNFDSSDLQFWKKSVRNYFSAMTFADMHVGLIWDAIKRSRHADNTLIVIVADHGLHLGERDRFRKHTLWEQVANVPLIIHDPAHPEARVVTDPVGLIDVGPTILDYLDLPPIVDSPGKSLCPLMELGSDPDRAVPTFIGDCAAIRKGRYRFIRYGDGSTQLFDLAKDWWQTTNLGEGHPAYGDMQVAFAACCTEYNYRVVAQAAQ
ncbi:sulfatase-like hydrolase/transferase [Sulfitobacter aestuariivivens]|uniref:Sulfatase-like hydrolase/transferase n=1 Tax=Sulfitobacter aestuariivivens TaxID=2766981 RepID=A0A927HI72_9RHOB|nr:sulfatase-like hydrolase/transferase [Sulfitobacter aestuariivivens]MBD3665965.1 sulfatase-like hydrolase/transferase [Sulfitobacter aestuariivivens]